MLRACIQHPKMSMKMQRWRFSHSRSDSTQKMSPPNQIIQLSGTRV